MGFGVGLELSFLAVLMLIHEYLSFHQQTWEGKKSKIPIT